ncbi:MAG: hypothetical protein CMJ54_10290 [Planctomycetaceae bacterium]|nr:hypothetical protein [Planctomycetaceae bacterium]
MSVESGSRGSSHDFHHRHDGAPPCFASHEPGITGGRRGDPFEHRPASAVEIPVIMACWKTSARFRAAFHPSMKKPFLVPFLLGLNASFGNARSINDGRVSERSGGHEGFSDRHLHRTRRRSVEPDRYSTRRSMVSPRKAWPPNGSERSRKVG